MTNADKAEVEQIVNQVVNQRIENLTSDLQEAVVEQYKKLRKQEHDLLLLNLGRTFGPSETK